MYRKESHAADLVHFFTLMDTTILVDEVTRGTFLRSVMHSFGCTYICLWSYSQPLNCLHFWDGRYNEENNQAQRLFHDYCQQLFPVSNYDCVPGLAFKNSRHYVELNESELHRLASNETQRRFYQEARIKIAVFMACKSGEIEFGLSHSTQINMEIEMRNLFPVQDLSRQSPAKDQLSLPLPTDPNMPSSSSSSLRSLSMDSPDSSSLLFNIPSTTHLPEGPSMLPIMPTTTSPHQQAMQAFAQIRNLQLPTSESEDAVMTRAILAVLTASSSPSSSSSSSHHQPQQNLPPGYQVSPKASAFKNYNLGVGPSTSQMRTSLRAQSTLKRAISYYKRLNTMRREHSLASRPTSTQLHHMMSERKRREKLNESFQALRSLLPPGTKKDKASLLISTREYLSSLKDQVVELTDKNKKLEAQLLPPASASKEAAAEASASTANQRLGISITPVSESTSEDRIINLGLTVTAEAPLLDLVIRILEFLKQPQNNNVSLISMDANTRIAESASSNHLNFRLRIIQGSEWDESVFQEAVRRVVADLAQ